MCCFGGPVAQLDRAPGYEPGCRRFDSSQARHFRWISHQAQIPVLFRSDITMQRSMLRQQQSRNNQNADENNHGDSALDPGSGDGSERSRPLLWRHRWIEHSDAGDFSRRNTSARRRCLRFRFILAISKFVRHYPPCYSHSQNPVQRCKFVRRDEAGQRRSAVTARTLSTFLKPDVCRFGSPKRSRLEWCCCITMEARVL